MSANYKYKSRCTKVYSKVLGRVIENIRPDSGILERCSAVAKLIDAEIKKKRVDAEAILGGSIAKGTFLRNDYDCDVFVKFDFEKYKEKNISKILKSILNKFKPKTLNGSREYFQFFKEKIKFEVVPVLNIKNARDAINVMDVSPLHVDWTKRRIKKNPRLADEVRMARAFCKANKVYGAESFIKGFSGHVIDILTIHYGGFLNLLKNAEKWGEKEKKEEKAVVDPENYHKGKALFNLNASKTEGPLVLVDPVQPDRNAAASVSKENFEILVNAAGNFLKNPSEKFFEEKAGIEEEYHKYKSKNALLKLEVSAFHGKEDVVGCKLLKAFEYIADKLRANDFAVVKKDWSWDREKKAFFYYVLDKTALKKTAASKYIIIKGPPMNLKEHAERFRKKHKETFVKKNILFAKTRRKFLKPEELIKDLKQDKYLREKVKEIRIINF